MVAGENSNAFSRHETPLLPGVGKGVRSLVELTEAELPALVDDRRATAVPDRRLTDSAAQQPESLEAENHLRQPVGGLGSEHPAANAQSSEVGLIAEALGEFGGITEKRPTVTLAHPDRVAQDGSWVEIHDWPELMSSPESSFAARGASALSNGRGRFAPHQASWS